MTIIVGLDDLSKALIDSGNNLLGSPSTDELLCLLDETESLLRNVEQDPPVSMQSALIPSKNALVSVDLLSHPDSDVRVSVASCLAEIVRITAPEAPYNDDHMKVIFKLTIEAFQKLADSSSCSYKKAESVLDNVAKVRSCLVMLDLECYDLILNMFRTFLKIIRPDHPQVVLSSMEMIMITVIDETEEVCTDVLDILLASVKKENQHVSPMSWSLAEKVLSRCARKLKPYIIKALKSTGTSLDMYSPVVSYICQTVSDNPKVYNIVNTRQKEIAETKVGRPITPNVSLEENLDLEPSRKENLSKRPARDGTRRINEKEKLRNGNNSSLLTQSLKQVCSENTDTETDIRNTRKRGRKPNSLMNPDEYDISWLSENKDPLETSPNKKIQKKVGKGSAKKTFMPKETTPATSRAMRVSLKRKRVKMSESDYDSESLSSPRMKNLASCFMDEEPPKDEEDDKIGNSSKNTRSQNGLEKSHKTAKNKPIIEAKMVNSGGRRSSARSYAKRKNLERPSLDTPVQQSSKIKKFDTNGFGEELVGKRVNIWWPLDKTFYEGVIECYFTRNKKHRVIYADGESEDLNLIKERWELLEDDTSGDEEVDLPESIPLSDILQRQKVEKSKKVAMSVELTSSSGVRSSSRTVMKKGSGKKLNKKVEKTREEKNLRSLRGLDEETDRTSEEQELSLEAEYDRRDEQGYEYDSSEKPEEQSKRKGEETKSKEEDRQFVNSEIESENEDSEFEEEPKWRETEEEEEEEEEVDDRGESSRLSMIEKEEDEKKES